jgi:hypothetical protein
MAAQVLDYSLNNFKIPGLAQYTPPFGTKKADGSGLTTAEITVNEMMTFMKQRSISGVASVAGNDPPMGVISTDSIASPIQFDANFSVAAGIQLQLADPSYDGQIVRVVASFGSGSPAAITLGIAGTPQTVSLPAGGVLLLFGVNGKWVLFDLSSRLREWAGPGAVGFSALNAAELARRRLLPLEGQVISISLYQDLCQCVYVGDSLNASAPAFYKTSNSTGTTRSTSGSYMVLPDARGIFIRGTGQQTKSNTWTDGQGNSHTISTLYDGKSIGTFICDAIRNLDGYINFHTNNGEQNVALHAVSYNGSLRPADNVRIAQMTGVQSSTSPGGVRLLASALSPYDTHNHGPSVSFSIVISY